MIRFRDILTAFLLLMPLATAAQEYFPTLKWQKFYGTGGDDFATCLEKSADGNLFMGGYVAENNGKSGCTNIWVVKLRPDGSKLWEREFGGSGCDELRDMAATPDSGVIFVGISNSFIEHPEKGQEDYQGDYFIGKLSKNGEIEWLRTYGGLDVDQAFAVTPGPNGEYMVAGASNSQNFDVNTERAMSNLWCVKISPKGEKETAWAFGGDKHDWAFSISSTTWGDYVFAGYTNSEDIDGTERRANGDGWIGKIDRYGSIQWQKIFSGKFEDFFTKVIEDKEGRIVAVGNFESEEKGKQFWFLKLSSTGKKIYEQIFGGSMDEYGTSVAECKSGGYIMTGYSRYYTLENSYIKGGEDFWVIRLDSRGEVLWRNTYGGRNDERAMDVVELDTGVYYVLGQKVNDFQSNGQPGKKNDFWLIRVEEESCDNIDINVVTSLDANTAYANKNFKVKAVVSKAEGYLWDFGDGNTSREAEPVHKYSEPGVYDIKVTVFINENCTKTYTIPEPVMVW